MTEADFLEILNTLIAKRDEPLRFRGAEYSGGFQQKTVVVMEGYGSGCGFEIELTVHGTPYFKAGKAAKMFQKLIT